MPINYNNGRFHVILWVDDAGSTLLNAGQVAVAKDKALAYSEFYVPPLSGVAE